jgi:WD40 repeat protein
MQLVSTASDGLVKLWNVKDEECVKTLDNHEDKDDCLGWGGFNCDFLGGLHGGRAGGTESEIASCSATVSHLRGYTVLGANTPSASRISQTTST